MAFGGDAIYAMVACWRFRECGITLTPDTRDFSLEDAYRSGAKVYAAAFNETEHDWVFDSADDTLSRNVEWAMFRFARFDFTSIRGDILTGIYDRFLDPKQRKAQGESRTPRLASLDTCLTDWVSSPTTAVLDPACGSGTFLIERYQQAVGEDADRGLPPTNKPALPSGILRAMTLIPSQRCCPTQLLWHLLSFGKEVKAHGIPAIHVSERANSLVPTDLRDQTTTRFGDIDLPGYTAVVGNPPYVCPERGQDLERTAHTYYTQTLSTQTGSHTGISVESNLYNLFIYRALDYWCSIPDAQEGRNAGKLALVVPLGFCVANNSADLRSLFAPGGALDHHRDRGYGTDLASRIRRRCLPMILFAEARPSTAMDRVVVRHVDEASVAYDKSNRKARPIFDLTVSPESHLEYADLFTPEGRIATRATSGRAAIVKKLRGLGQLSDAAKTYWTKRKGGFQAQDVKPTGMGEALWEEQRMISDGVARRGTGTENSPNGLDIYKEKTSGREVSWETHSSKAWMSGISRARPFGGSRSSFPPACGACRSSSRSLVRHHSIRRRWRSQIPRPDPRTPTRS